MDSNTIFKPFGDQRGKPSIARKFFRQDLDCDVALELGIAGAIYVPVPPLPSNETTSYAPSFCPM